MTKPNYQKAQFLLSVANMNQLPPDQGTEVAIVGRSNAGKSSVLNQLTQNKQLARTSKTPGRTQLINLFGIDAERRLADLPGYGYANVPLKVKQQWEILLDQYFRSRHCLRGLILVMDSRHPLKEFDENILEWSSECNLPVHILLNKIDKLSTNELKKAMHIVTAALPAYENAISVQPFSALKGTGVKELRIRLDEWFTC